VTIYKISTRVANLVKRSNTDEAGTAMYLVMSLSVTGITGGYSTVVP
jgi:hypothetical protein